VVTISSRGTHLLFECIATLSRKNMFCMVEKKTQHCAPTPNGPFHCYARGPDPRCQGVLSRRVVVLCSSCRRTRTHNHPVGLPLLHQRSFLERSLWSSIADRTIGIRLHCNFTVALPDVAGTAVSRLNYTS
jgi:hypothetical protein